MSPNYRQRANDSWEDREGFAHPERSLREISAFAEIQVLDELRDGAEVIMEVFRFAEKQDSGLFLCIEETTLMLKGTERSRFRQRQIKEIKLR